MSRKEQEVRDLCFRLEIIEQQITRKLKEYRLANERLQELYKQLGHDAYMKGIRGD